MLKWWWREELWDWGSDDERGLDDSRSGDIRRTLKREGEKWQFRCEAPWLTGIGCGLERPTAAQLRLYLTPLARGAAQDDRGRRFGQGYLLLRDAGSPGAGSLHCSLLNRCRRQQSSCTHSSSRNHYGTDTVAAPYTSAIALLQLYQKNASADAAASTQPALTRSW